MTEEKTSGSVKDPMVYITVGVRKSELDGFRKDRECEGTVGELDELTDSQVLEAACLVNISYSNELYVDDMCEDDLRNSEDIKIRMIKHELIEREHSRQHMSVRDEIAMDEFCFIDYWTECEGNKGERMSLEDVWAELIKDITPEEV